jgi:hypothetical protein
MQIFIKYLFDKSCRYNDNIIAYKYERYLKLSYYEYLSVIHRYIQI